MSEPKPTPPVDGASVTGGRQEEEKDQLSQRYSRTGGIVEPEASSLPPDNATHMSDLINSLAAHADFLNRKMNGNYRIGRRVLRRMGVEMRIAASLLKWFAANTNVPDGEAPPVPAASAAVGTSEPSKSSSSFSVDLPAALGAFRQIADMAGSHTVAMHGKHPAGYGAIYRIAKTAADQIAALLERSRQ
jgi:hypothetical protein